MCVIIQFDKVVPISQLLAISLGSNFYNLKIELLATQLAYELYHRSLIL